jgi:hypothetical protein
MQITKYIGLSLCALLLGVAHPVFAVTFESLGNDDIVGDFVVGPGKIELSIEPGESETVNLLVSNRMGDDRIFTLTVEDVRGSDNPEETVVLLGDDRGPYSLRDYLSYEEVEFELMHGTRAVVPVTVSVPANAEPGGYYGSVLVSTASKPNATTSPQEHGATRVISRIGALFFVRVPGEVAEAGSLAAFGTLDSSAVFARGPIQFSVSFQNSGSVHLNPHGEIRIRNLFGHEVGVVPVSPWYALPDSIRFREVSWDRVHLLGYYTAEARINRGYGGIVDTATTSFFVIPWMLLLAVFAALVVAFLLVRLVISRYEFRRKEQ